MEQARLSFRDEIEINVIFNTRNQYFHANDLSFWGHNIMIRPLALSSIPNTSDSVGLPEMMVSGVKFKSFSRIDGSKKFHSTHRFHRAF